MKDRTRTAHWLGLAAGIALMGGGMGPVAAQETKGRPGVDFNFIYSTFLGGSGSDQGNGIAVTPSGSAYVTGMTTSPDFPTSPGAVQPGPFPNPVGFVDQDAFVAAYAPLGQRLYSTYLGTQFPDSALDIAVGPGGSAYITGIRVDLEQSYAFAARLSPTGSVLVYFHVSFVGSRSVGHSIAVDPQGNAYVTGSRNDPVFDPTSFGRAFVVKLDTNGKTVFSVDLDGAEPDEGRAIGLDAAGNLWVAGLTSSTDFPTRNAEQGSYGGGLWDGFITKLSPSGEVLVSTYLGGSGLDEVWDLAVAPDGGVYVAGITRSADFPVTADALQPSLKGAQDEFVARLSPSGELLHSTFMGGSGEFDEPRGLAVGPSGDLYLGSATTAFDHPFVDPEFDDCRVGLVGRLDLDVPEIVQSACVLDAVIFDIAVDAAETVFLTGWARDIDFPVVNAFQPVSGGSRDAFVTRLTLNRAPVCSAALATPSTIWPPNGKLVPITISGVTDPDGDPITLTVTSVQQDEPLSRAGTPDAIGIGTPAVSLRADRAGQGDGRTYHVSFSASDGQGGTCTGTVRVCVPHDQGRGRTCGDGGALFNSRG